MLRLMNVGTIRRKVATLLVMVLLLQIPFTNVEAKGLDFSGKMKGQETVYFDGVEFNIQDDGEYWLVTSEYDSKEFEMKYFQNGKAKVTIESGLGETKEYELEVDTKKDDIDIKIFEDGEYIESVSESPDEYKGQAAIAAGSVGYWLFSAAVSAVVTYEAYQKLSSSSKPQNPVKVSDNVLKKNGYDAHQIKKDYKGSGNNSRYDLYVDKKTGRIWIYGKGGKGVPEPTHIYLKSF